MNMACDEVFSVITSLPNRKELEVNSLPQCLPTDEENIIRYACGYVGMKLYNHFVKQPGEKAAAFVECIDHMRSEGPTSSLQEYTREWVEKVNRGELFDVSDEAYNLFIAIEVAMVHRLTSHLKSSVDQLMQNKERMPSLTML